MDRAPDLWLRRRCAGAVSSRPAAALAIDRGCRDLNEFSQASPEQVLPMALRFRGFLPVVIDVECGGFNPNTDALLEIAAVLPELRGDGTLVPGAHWRYHIQPFPGANIEAASLAVNGIDPHHPLRPAIDEKEALTRLFKDIRQAIKDNECTRAILVGHNAYF